MHMNNQPVLSSSKRPLIYVLHSGNLYGTEQMALATVQGLRDTFEPVLFAPPGPVHPAAKSLGIQTHEFNSPLKLAKKALPVFKNFSEIKLITTGVSQSLVVYMLGQFYGRSMTHLHIVHGGTDERLSYGRKALLKHLPVELVAVSEFVKNRLVAHGCLAERVHTIENFQTQPATAIRPVFDLPGVRRIAVISRADPIKRVAMIFDAMERYPHLRSLDVEIFGAGSDFEQLKARSANMPNITMHGFVPNASDKLPDFDLLLHTCAEEPFGLAILEAMASHVPVLAPNAGGAGSLIENGITGFQFPANDTHGLARVLRQLQDTPAQTLNRIVNAASLTLSHRFSPQRGLAQYLTLLESHP